MKILPRAAACLWVTILAATLPSSSIASDLHGAEEAYRFASYLLAEGEYYRAVTEFRRAMYWAPTSHDELKWKSALGVGQALYAGGEYARTGEWLAGWRSEIRQPQLHSETLRLMSRAFLMDWRAQRLLYVLEEAETKWDDRDFYTALALAQTGKWEESQARFSEIPSSSSMFAWATQNADHAGYASDQGRKSPTVGGILGITPGAGYLYSGHYQSAFSTLLVCGLFGWATVEAFGSDNNVLGGVLGAITLTWYGSSIYGSVKAADRYNDHSEKELFGELKW